MQSDHLEIITNHPGIDGNGIKQKIKLSDSVIDKQLKSMELWGKIRRVLGKDKRSKQNYPVKRKARYFSDRRTKHKD